MTFGTIESFHDAGDESTLRNLGRSIAHAFSAASDLVRRRVVEPVARLASAASFAAVVTAGAVGGMGAITVMETTIFPDSLDRPGIVNINQHPELLKLTAR